MASDPDPETFTETYADPDPDPENERITETLTGVNPVLQELALGEHDDPSSREAAGDLSPPSVVRGLRLLPPDPPEFFGLGERGRGCGEAWGSEWMPTPPDAKRLPAMEPPGHEHATKPTWIPPDATPAPGSKRVLLVAIVALLLVMVAGAGWLLRWWISTPAKDLPGGAGASSPSASAPGPVASAGSPPSPASASTPPPERVAVPAECPPGMVLIPGGTFKMGSDDGDPDEKPVHEVTLPSFCLDRTEVTVGAYAACVKTGKCTAAPTKVDWPGISEADRALWSQFCNADRADRLDHPVNCVNWGQADAYCAAQGGRLPTEREWEYAARGGSEQRSYPWGDKPPPGPELLNACGSECVARGRELGRTWSAMYPGDDHFAGTGPVMSFSKGKSRWGNYDMSGNVTEWTQARYCPYPSDGTNNCANERRVLRGGSWFRNDLSRVRAAFRSGLDASGRGSNVGFRCARG